VYEEWSTVRISLLHKKGGLSLYKKWFGSCLLGVASTILSSMMVACMKLVMEKEGMGENSSRRRGASLFACST
jgi:hypothetical protein